MVDLTGLHPNITVRITGYDPEVDEKTKGRYPLGAKFAHVPLIPGIRYRLLFADGWNIEEERQQVMCPYCHSFAKINEGDYIVGKRGKQPIQSSQ